ncbi:MAG TPA: phage tail tape measure protein [Microlunatus sp.]
MADDIEVSLDPSGYLAGVNQIDAANQQLQASFAKVTTSTTLLQKGMAVITPSRAMLGGMTVLAARSAETQKNLSQLAATSTVTGARVDKLAGGIRSLAKELPLGTDAARQLVEQFSKSGISAEGSEKKIIRLSKSIALLSGATGEAPNALAEGMTNLARATGNVNLDPKRIEDLGDSLTTVAAKSGASATSILAFSKNIAPMAQAAGIGATGILGISGAFAKMGEEGYAASNAVSKMLGDMSRSVREGSPEIATYANLVGKTADQFSALFKNNPAEALNEVTQAIARAGPSGPRMLERIGIEGVRGQRAIQNLVAGGQLQQTTAQAVSAYGGGATEKAGEAAFGGLEDSLTRLASASDQVAEAMGRPLLGPLTTFADAMTKVTGGLGELLGSAPMQALGTAATYGGMGLVAGKAVLGPLGALALGRQGATSGPVRAVMAGITGVTGSQGRMSRLGGYAQEAYDEDRMGPINRWLYDQSAGAARRWQERNPPGGPSVLSRIRTGGQAYGSNLLQSYMGMVGQQYSNAAQNDPFERSASMGASRGFRQAAAYASYAAPPGASSFEKLTAGMKAFHSELLATTGETATFKTNLKAMGMMAKETAKFGGTVAGDAARAGGGLLKGMAGFLGPTAALAGAGMLVGNIVESTSNLQASNQAVLDLDIEGALNAYRESVGAATSTTKKVSEVSADLSAQLGERSKALGYGATKEITERDVAAAQNSRDQAIRKYLGSPEEIAAQLQNLAPGGVKPQELQAIKVDMLRTLQPDVVREVMKQLPASFQAGEGPVGGALTPGLIGGSVQGITNAPRSGGWWQERASAAGNMNPSWFRQPWSPGGIWYGSPLSETSQQNVADTATGIAKQADMQAAKFGPQVTRQEQAKLMNAAVTAARKTGDNALVYEYLKHFVPTLEAGLKDAVFTEDELAAATTADGTLDVMLLIQQRMPESKIATERTNLFAAGGTTVPGVAGLAKKLLPGIGYEQMAPEAPTLSQAFDVRKTNLPMQQAMARYMELPESVDRQVAAIDAVVLGFKDAGKSLNDVAIESFKAAGAIQDTTSSEYIILKQVQRRAEIQAEYEGMSAGETPAQAQMRRYQLAQAKTTGPIRTPEERQEVEAAQGAVAQGESEMAARMAARLQLERDYQKQSLRAWEDYARSKQYAEEDSLRAETRMREDFAVQEREMRHQAGVAIARSEEDLRDQRFRAMRDFHRQATRAEVQFQLVRRRAWRDFNIQLRRAIEDSASQMYDPYKRIQTQATWDAKNLIGNLQEQVDALKAQKKNLDQLQGMGLTNEAINQLGLNKAENAQQVRNLVADAQISPEVLAQINAVAKAKAEAAGALYTDESNNDIRRQREDLLRSFADQEADLKKSLENQLTDLRISLGDARFELDKSHRRMNTDLEHNLAVMRTAMGVNMTRMTEDRDRGLSRMRDSIKTQLGRMHIDIVDSDKVIVGDMKTLHNNLVKAMRGDTVNWSKIVKNDTNLFIADVQKNVLPRVASLYSPYGPTFTTTVGIRPNPKTEALNSRAEGGEVTGRSMHEKQDNILTWLTGGEFVQNVHAVRKYGTEAMHAINNRSVSKEALLEAVRGYAGGGWVNPVAPVRPGFPWGHYPSGGIHRALDYPVRTGTPVYSPYAGTILQSGWSSTGFGNHIRMLNSIGTYSILGHMSRLFAGVGDKVTQRQLLGWSGSTGRSTGPHLHLEMRTRLGDPASAYNFTLGAPAAELPGATAGVLKPDQIEKLFSSMKNRPGVYNSLVAGYKKFLKAQSFDTGGIMPHGGAGFNDSGKPEKVLTDDQWRSVTALAARGGSVSMEQIRGVQSAGGINITINNSGAVTYDSRNDFAGAHISVTAQDPNEMARKLQAQQTRQRLTQTRGVRRGS